MTQAKRDAIQAEIKNFKATPPPAADDLNLADPNVERAIAAADTVRAKARSQPSPPCGGGRERSLSWGAGAPPPPAHWAAAVSELGDTY